MDQLFSIGDVAKLFHLSVSSLRHYEALGLLTPERVDPNTGYRSYSIRQFEVLNTIRYLRALDMPLEEIADFLRDRDVERIEEKLSRQREAVLQRQRELERVRRKIDNRQTDLAVLGCYGRKHYHRRCEYQRHAAGAAFGDGQLCDAG